MCLISWIKNPPTNLTFDFQFVPPICIYLYLYLYFYHQACQIDLVTIFDCDYWWYCTIDYVIVNYIGIHHLFYHIQWFFSHQSSIAHKRWNIIKWKAWLSARIVALHAGVLDSNPVQRTSFQFWYATIKRG